MPSLAVQAIRVIPYAVLSRRHPHASVLELDLRRVLLCLDRLFSTTEEKLRIQ